MVSIPSEVRQLAREHTLSAIRALVSIVDNDEAVPMARVQAANSLLDRGWGKNNQPVSPDNAETLDNARILCHVVDPKSPDETK